MSKHKRNLLVIVIILLLSSIPPSRITTEPHSGKIETEVISPDTIENINSYSSLSETDKITQLSKVILEAYYQVINHDSDFNFKSTEYDKNTESSNYLDEKSIPCK